MALAPGTVVGRYEIRDVLGSGGMGEVYKAHDPVLGRTVALKVLRLGAAGDSGGLARFAQEARAASALNHPNILTIHEFFQHEGAHFLAAELVEGETLRTRLARGPVALKEVLDIAIQTTSALTVAHAAGIVHRDVKPENVMIRPDHYVKVLDFGVAKLAAPKPVDAGNTPTVASFHSGTGMVVGTMAYMSPEQARGLDVDGRSDVFSVGILLYELLTGRPPFSGPTPSDTLVAILDKEPPPLRLQTGDLPPQLDWVITKALDKDPGLRYQSMADLRVDLMRLKMLLDSGRLARPASASHAAVDQPLDVAISEDDPRVRALGALSRGVVAATVLGVVALIAALTVYDTASFGAGIPLESPEGAVLTKAKDGLESLGYKTWGTRQASAFQQALSVKDVAALAGLPAAREAVHDGATAQWAVAITPERDPDPLMSNPDNARAGEFSLRLDPRGRLQSFVTGAASAPNLVPLDKEQATRLGVDTVKRQFSVDPAGYEFDFVPRTIPAGTVEMTWRNPSRRFGHVEQIRVTLQADRVVRLQRAFEKPPGFVEPPTASRARTVGRVTPVVGILAFVAAYAFGMLTLFRAKAWDAVRHPIPIALSLTMVLAVAAAALSESFSLETTPIRLMSAVFVAGILLPAMGGLFFWLRRRHAVRFHSAAQILRGRVFDRAVTASLILGAIAAASLTAMDTLADLLVGFVPAYLPSTGGEVAVVTQGVIAVVCEGAAGGALMGVGIALSVEVLEAWGLNALLSVAVPAIVMALMGINVEQGSALVIGLRYVQAAVSVGVLAWLYRTRGLLAIWVVGFLQVLLHYAMAARSFAEPSVALRGNMALAVVVIVAGLGVWGLVANRRESSAG